MGLVFDDFKRFQEGSLVSGRVLAGSVVAAGTVQVILTIAAAHPLGLLTRKLVDWQAAEELTANLRLLDPSDPVKYDFALFGAGVDK